MIKRSDLASLFGPIYKHDEWAAPSWENEGKFMVLCVLPEGFEKWINTATGKSVKHIYMNKFMRDAFLQALQNARDAGLCGEFKTFDGAFQIRDVRGVPGKVSAHSYGLAFDMNAKTNALGEKGDMNPKLVEIFEKQGFIWGGRFKRLDPMHWQYVLEC